MKDSILNNKGYVILSTVLLILLWQIIALIVGKPIILPTPKDTFTEVIRLIGSAHFLKVLVQTLARVFLGFGISLLMGLFLGLLGGFINPVYYLLKPLITVQRAIPTMAIILMTLIWLSSELAPVLVGFLVIFPLIYSSVVIGVRNIDGQLLEMAKLYQVGLGKKIKKLYLPAIRNILIGTLSTTLSLNLKITIAAEVLSQPQYGIGTSFQIEKSMLNTAGVFAWAAITIMIAGAFDVLLRMIHDRVQHMKAIKG